MGSGVKTAKVSSKGQITLPREVRRALGTDHVRIVYSTEEGVRIEPLNDVAGSLAHYLKRKKKIPFDLARERAWGAVVREKHKRR
jgi:bifunctional DNA-binding transcriptional regulator/antitoxin component of YhaV-PrlF toxin-antitoxin module